MNYNLFLNIPRVQNRDFYFESINGLLNNLEKRILSIQKVSQYFDDDVLDYIEKSKMLIFCLTNDYLKSYAFKRDFNLVNNDKICLYALLEPIDENLRKDYSIDLNEVRVIELYKQYGFDSENLSLEPLYRLCTLVSYYLHKQNKMFIQNETNCIKYKPITSKVFSIHKTEDLVVSYHDTYTHRLKLLFDCTQWGYLILSSHNYSFELFDKKTLTFTRRAPIGFYVHLVCFIKHLGYLCIKPEYTYSFNFYDKSFQLVFSKKLEEKCEILNMVYNDVNQYIYLNCNKKYIKILNDQFEIVKSEVLYKEGNKLLKDLRSMIISNNQLFVVTCTDRVYVYDAELNFLTTFGQDNLLNASHICVDFENPMFIYVFESKNTIKVFDSINFTYIGQTEKLVSNMQAYYENSFIISNNKIYLCISRRDASLKVFNFNVCKNANILNQAYFNESEIFCHLNSNKVHLLNNPFILPCGNTACFECIFKQYNGYLDTFKCFKSCNKNHNLFKDSIKRSNIIEEKLNFICRKIINYRIKDADLSSMLEIFYKQYIRFY